jgi:hypothetical protein
MDNINDLIGDAAKQLMAQADGIQNQKLKASAQRVAQTVSAKTRDELISVARSDAYGRDTRFIKYLPITWRQKAVMGRVYSFQCTTNKDGTPGEFRMSLATAGKDLNITRDNLKNDLRQLVEPDGDELVSQLGKRRWRVMGDPEDGWWVEVDSDGNELPGDWEYDRKGGYVYCSFS